MNTAVMFSKASDEWSTPDDVFRPLAAEFGLEVDAAATLENRKLLDFFGPESRYANYTDALTADWWKFGPLPPRLWLNPPYSQCRAFMAKAKAEAARGCLVVCLVPARTDTRWWHESVWDGVNHRPRPGVEVRFLKGRLKFGGATAGAPFPSAIIILRPSLT